MSGNSQILCHPYASPTVPQIHQPSVLSCLICGMSNPPSVLSLLPYCAPNFTCSGNYALLFFQQVSPEAARAVLSVPMRGTASWLFLVMHGMLSRGIPGIP